MLGTLTRTGQIGQASPRREKQGVLAVINHVSGSALGCLPPARADGGRPLLPAYGTAPNSFPRRIGNRLIHPIASTLLGVACAPPGGGALGGGSGIRAGTAVIFQFGLTSGDEFGDHARREGMQRLPVIGVSHDRNHGGTNVQEVGRLVQGSSYV